MNRPNLLLPFAMLVPSLALALWIIGYPIADLMRMSVSSVNRFGQVGGFIGAVNFSKLFADPLFWASFRRTILWTVVVTGGTTLISIPVAMMLAQDFAGRAIARLIVLLPWAVSATMTGIVWRWTLNGQFGMLNAILMPYVLKANQHAVAPRLQALARYLGLPADGPGAVSVVPPTVLPVPHLLIASAA